MKKEAIDLRFSERIGAFLLDGVLSREDEEELGEPLGRIADRHLPLLHRLEERALDLGGRAVDLIGEDEVREDRPAPSRELSCALIVDHRADHIGGEEIRRELNAAKIGLDRLRERIHHQGFGEARHALDEDMASDQKADEDPLDHLVLADNGALHFFADSVEEGALADDHLVDGADINCHESLYTKSRWSA